MINFKKQKSNKTKKQFKLYIVFFSNINMSFTNKKSIGIDISDQTIEAVELGKENNDIKVISVGRIILEPGIVAHGRIKDKTKLKLAVTQILAQAKPAPIETKSANFALPDSQLFLHVFSRASNNELLVNEIRAEAEKNIPIPAADLTYAYRVLKKNVDGKRIVLIACSKLVVKEWQDFFNELGLNIALFDAEALAVYRAIYDKLPTRESVGILDIGARTTNLAIFSKLGLAFAASLPIAGNSFSKAITESLKIDSHRAEELKIKHGLIGAGAIKDVLTEQIKILLKEVEENIKYYQDKYNENVHELILLGGSSQMPDFKNHINFLNLSNQIKIKLGQTRLAMPVKGIEYIEACGLAIRELEEDWNKTDPAILSQTGADNKKADDVSILIFLKNQLTKINHKVFIGSLFGLLVIAVIIFFASGRQKINPEVKPPITVPSPLLDQPAMPVDVSSEQPREIIRIKQLDQNLNVRSGPGTSYSIVSQAVSLTEYPLLEEQAGWFKISLPDGQAGWVYASFTEKIIEN